VGDFECGRDIGDYDTISNITFGFTKLKSCIDVLSIEHSKKILNAKDDILRIIRNTVHLHEVCGPRFRSNNEDINQDARIKFITKKYDDKKFTSIIHKNNKAISKKQDIFNVIQLQHQGITDIVFRIIEAVQPINNININTITYDNFDSTWREIARNINELFKEIKTLSDYSNNLLREHSTTYQCKLWTLRTSVKHQTNVFR